MNDIIIRQGRKEDETAVWRLLHAEGMHSCIEKFAGNPENCFVLMKGCDLLGVFLGPGEVVVHPLYSQSLVGDVLAKAVTGLLNLPARLKRGNHFILGCESAKTKKWHNSLREGLTNGSHQYGQD